MKLKLTKPPIFISGFVAGVCTAIVVALYHDIMSMQPQPVVEDEDWLYNMSHADLLRVLAERGAGKPAHVAIGMLRGERLAAEDKTQPVYIGEPENEWRPEPWHDDIGGM